MALGVEDAMSWRVQLADIADNDARVSACGLDAEGQHDRLAEAGAIRVFSVIVSGAADGPEPARLIDHARPGYRLCVTRLDW